jgi:hypothetical protein
MVESVLFPSGYKVEVNQLRQQLDQAHFAWWQQWKAEQPEFKIENIRFKHVAGWDRKFFSIQSAHSGNHPIWKATRVIWFSLGETI